MFIFFLFFVKNISHANLFFIRGEQKFTCLSRKSYFRKSSRESRMSFVQSIRWIPVEFSDDKISANEVSGDIYL